MYPDPDYYFLDQFCFGYLVRVIQHFFFFGFLESIETEYVCNPSKPKKSPKTLDKCMVLLKIGLVSRSWIIFRGLKSDGNEFVLQRYIRGGG